MQIEISDEVYTRFRDLLRERRLSDDISTAVERLIELELKRCAVPGYETDPLTGCKTRFQLEREVNERTWGRGYQDTSPFIGRYLCVDIDDFKSYLDVQGLQAGDAVLVSLARQLRCLYPEANVYRIGGDDFVVELGEGDVKALPPIDGLTVKYSLVSFKAARDRDRLHHLNGRIVFHLDEGLLRASPAGTVLNVEYGLTGEPWAA